MQEREPAHSPPACRTCGDPLMTMDVEELTIELCPRCDGVPLCPDDARIIAERRAREQDEAREE